MFFGKRRDFIGMNGWAASLMNLILLDSNASLQVHSPRSKRPTRFIKTSSGNVYLWEFTLPNGIILFEEFQEEKVIHHARRTWANIFTALRDDEGWIEESRWTSEEMAIFSTPTRTVYPFHSRSSHHPHPLATSPVTPSVQSFFAQQAARPS